MEYLHRMPLRYEHIARHARSIPGMPVISHARSWFADCKCHMQFKRGGAKKPIIESSWNNGEKNRLDLCQVYKSFNMIPSVVFH